MNANKIGILFCVFIAKCLSARMRKINMEINLKNIKR